MLLPRPKRRKRIRPTDKAPLRLSDRERALIIEKTFAPDELTRRLRLAAVDGAASPAAFTLDEWEELHGYVAAEANHCRSRALQRDLYRICERLQQILDSHTDEE